MCPQRPSRPESRGFTFNRLCALPASIVPAQPKWHVPSTHASGVEAARRHRKNKKPLSSEIVLRLPDLDHSKNAVLNGVVSPEPAELIQHDVNFDCFVAVVSHPLCKGRTKDGAPEVVLTLELKRL